MSTPKGPQNHCEGHKKIWRASFHRRTSSQALVALLKLMMSDLLVDPVDAADETNDAPFYTSCEQLLSFRSFESIFVSIWCIQWWDKHEKTSNRFQKV